MSRSDLTFSTRFVFLTEKKYNNNDYVHLTLSSSGKKKKFTHRLPLRWPVANIYFFNVRSSICAKLW